MQVILDTLEYATRIKKTPVVVGNCTGFAVNRVFFPYTQVGCLMNYVTACTPVCNRGTLCTSSQCSSWSSRAVLFCAHVCCMAMRLLLTCAAGRPAVNA